MHPADCQVREFFAQRLQQQTGGFEGASARMPTSPADLMLRMVDYMVDSYLELRKFLTKELDALQVSLFGPRSRPNGWRVLLELRKALHVLEKIGEDQRAAVTEWVDALAEWPEEHDAALRRDREQLRVRSRDVLEHTSSASSPTFAASKRLAKPRCRCTFRSGTTAPTTSCARSPC